MWTRSKAKILFLVLATLGVTTLHFLVGTGSHGLHVIHILLAGASLFVIGTGALWYGLRGGMTTAVATSVLYLIHVTLAGVFCALTEEWAYNNHSGAFREGGGC